MEMEESPNTPQLLLGVGKLGYQMGRNVPAEKTGQHSTGNWEGGLDCENQGGP